MPTKKIKRLIALVLAIGVSSIGMIPIMSGVAHAAPSHCMSGWASDGVARAECSYGTGQFRAGIPCKSILTLGYGFTQYTGSGRCGSLPCRSVALARHSRRSSDHRGDTQLVYRTYWLLVDFSQSVRVKVPHQFF